LEKEYLQQTIEKTLAMTEKYDEIMQTKAIQDGAEHFLQKCYESTELPDISFNNEALTRFTYYLNNHIAETLKECANLYHRETEDSKIFNELQSVKDQIDEAAAAARSAANSDWILLMHFDTTVIK
jgi:hypothetical protein